MKSEKDKNSWLSLVLVRYLVPFLIISFSVWLLSWIPVISKDWENLHNSNSDTLNEKDKFNASLEIIKAIVGGAGTVATIAGGFVLYLNFRVANRNVEIANFNVEIANRNVEIAESRLITERFAKAVEQLGSEKLEVCLGGIYSLEKIAVESTDYRWTIMEILTAFVRYISLVHPDKDAPKNSLTYKTAIQTALTIIGKLTTIENRPEIVLDLNYAKLSNFTISGNFSRTDFRGTELKNASLQGAIFEKADFRDANLSGANLSKANFKYAIFTDANLNSTTIIDGDLESAQLDRAFLYKSDLRNANLQGADLSNAHIKEALFINAKLAGSNFSATNFWDSENWNHRHWTWEDHENESAYQAHLAQEELNTYYDDSYYDSYYEKETVYKPDFRWAEGLEPEQIQAAKNYTEGIYDDSMRKSLKIPEYQPSEIRDPERL